MSISPLDARMLKICEFLLSASIYAAHVQIINEEPPFSRLGLGGADLG